MKLFVQLMGLKVSAIGRRDNFDFKTWPKSSPFSVTENLFPRLASRAETLMYHHNEHYRINFSPEDVFIGHPRFPYARWPEGVTELSSKNRTRPGVFSLISPLHCNTDVKAKHINRDYLDSIDSIMPRVDIFFSIMGKYWWDRWESSPYSHWRAKMRRLDMAVDVEYYPMVKKRFNPPGKRKFLYIGRNYELKNTGFLSKLMVRAGKDMCGWIGRGKDLPGIHRISEYEALTPAFMEKIAEQYDFFITAGIADANPTTILESMAWGFPVICTPQSGYYETEYLSNIFADDIERSLEVLTSYQQKNEEELMRMAAQARAVVVNEHNWDVFSEKVLRGLFEK
jgi:glycosyltransferase involved in cell wall biosynthesis